MLGYQDIPGPRGRLLTGNLAEFRRDMLGFFARMPQEYGDLTRFRLGPMRCVLVNDPALIGDLLVKDSSHLTKSWDYREMRWVLGDGLVTSEGEFWRHQRRLIQPAFSRDRLVQYGSIMVRRTAEMTSQWSDGQVRNVADDMMGVTLEIVAESLFGIDVEDLVEPITKTLDETMDRFEAMFTSPLPLPLAVPTPANLRLHKSIRRLNGQIYEVIRRRREQGGESSDLLSRMVALTDEHGSQMTDKQLRDELVTLLMAGHETTALTLTWTFLLLSRNAEVRDRLFEELDTVLRGRIPSVDDLPKLPLAERIVRESMRLYPPVWGIGRSTAEPFELGGYAIDQRTQLFVSQWALHRDARFFPQPESFDPDRWCDANHPTNAYLPFGGGPRKCIGVHFAMMEAVLVLATISARYQIDIDPEHAIELQPAITLRPRNGLIARVSKRTDTRASAA